MRQVIKIRKLKPEERDEQESVLDLYKHALGMLPGGGVRAGEEEEDDEQEEAA